MSATLTDDNVLIDKTNGSEPGRVVVTKFIQCIPRSLFNSSGLGYVMKDYMVPASWSYLREMVQTSNNIKHDGNNFRISPSILNPKYVFVFFQKSQMIACANALVVWCRNVKILTLLKL